MKLKKLILTNLPYVLAVWPVSKLAEAVTLARQTRKIVKQNIIFILTVKLLVLILGAVGIATMWMAVFADVGVAVMAILNAIRIIRY